MMNKRMMRQAQQLQNRLAKAQEELEAMSVEGSAGGGVVRVTMTGKQEVTAVVIEPEAAEDIDLLQDLVAAAVNDAFTRHAGTSRREDGRGNRRHEHTRPFLARLNVQSAERRPIPGKAQTAGEHYGRWRHQVADQALAGKPRSWRYSRQNPTCP